MWSLEQYRVGHGLSKRKSTKPSAGDRTGLSRMVGPATRLRAEDAATKKVESCGKTAVETEPTHKKGKCHEPN